MNLAAELRYISSTGFPIPVWEEFEKEKTLIKKAAYKGKNSLLFFTSFTMYEMEMLEELFLHEGIKLSYIHDDGHELKW